MANAPQDDILCGGDFKVEIDGCPSAKDCVSLDCDPIEIEMHDVTQGNDTEWRTFTSGKPRYGNLRLTFRQASAEVTKDFQQWLNDAGRGINVRKNITAVLFKKDRTTEGRRYNFIDTFPISVNAAEQSMGADAGNTELVVAPSRIELQGA